MKIMNVLHTVLVAVVAIALPLHAADKSRVPSQQRRVSQNISRTIQPEIANKVTQVRKDLEAIVLEEAQKTVDAIMEKDQALRSIALNGVSPYVVGSIIEQQDKIIAEIKQNLPEKAREAGMMIDEMELEAGYFSQFFTGIKNQLIAGHSSTPLEKYLASAVIVKLQGLKKRANTQFDKQLLDNEIRNQKIITGDAWSRERRALWAGVTVLVTLGALMYLSTPAEAPAVDVPVDKTDAKPGILASIKEKLQLKPALKLESLQKK